MKKRTRLFLVGAAGVLVVGLGTGLLASFVGVENLGILSSDGPDELDYVPADARLVAFVNVVEVMDSELRKKIRPTNPDGDDKFQAETGINIENDIDHVVLFLAAPEGVTGQPTVLARGRFDEVRIRGFLEEQGASLEEYKGIRLLVNDLEHMSVAFAEPGLAIVGRPDEVRRAIDAKASGTNVRDNASLIQHVKDADDGNAWAVARFDVLAQGSLPEAVATRLPKISWFSATAFINGGVRGVIRADTRDEMAAQDLRDVIRGFVALARMQVGDQPALTDLMNSFELGGQGTTVSLGFAVTTDVIDAFTAFIPRNRPDDSPDAPETPEEPAPPTVESPTL